MRLAEQHKIVFCIQPEDHNSAGVDGDSVSLENYSHVTFIFVFGELTNNSVLKIYSGASAGTKTTAETFNYRACATDMGTSGGDLLATETTSAALTLTAATYEDRFIVVEMDADEFTDEQPFVTPEIDSTATELFVACVAILSKPRYAQNVPTTPLA